MPAFVRSQACDGCATLPVAACVAICPHDLMQQHATTGQAYNLEPDLCWECFACVKACPTGAIAVRGYADVMPLGAELVPRRAARSIAWNVTFRGGQHKHFEFPIRTTAWGSIRPHAGLAPPRPEQLHAPGLCGEERDLGVATLPRLARQFAAADNC